MDEIKNDKSNPQGGGRKTSKLKGLFRRDKKLTNDKSSAGAGVIGLIGFMVLFVVASFFFITENYFVSMFVMSIALMVYATGKDVARIFLSSFTIFFSSRHLIEKAAYLQENLSALKRFLGMTEGRTYDSHRQPLSPDTVLLLPNNPLSQDICQLVEEGEDGKYAEYIAHSYYQDCHELYEFTHDNLGFVAGAMPLFGLIGTIIGLIAMFDSLGANVTVESLAPQLALALKTTLYGAIFSSLYKIIGSRFDQRMKALNYDYETFCYGLDVIFEGKKKVGVVQ